jgi:O-antigen/teichoic acid export membrane protein
MNDGGSDLRGRVMSALRWSASARLLGQLFSWAVTIWVIRLLTPGDYGLMAMAAVLVAFLFGLNTLGLDAVLVQEEALDHEGRRQIFGLVIVTNLAFFALLFFGAGAAAGFYGEPALEPIVQVLSLQFLLLIFETLPQSQLERDIAFARRSVVELLVLVISSLTTLLLALLGFGVWSLVWGMVANTAGRVIGFNLISRSLVWPSVSVRGMAARLRFGAFVSTDRGLWFLFAESDKFIGGKLLGNHALGYYAVANQIASLPIQKLSGLISAVAFPAFSHGHAHEGDERVRHYLLTATRILAVAAFPVFLGIAATAEPIVALLLGEKWLPAVPLLQLLGLVMPFRLLANVFPPLLWGVGSPRTSASNYALAAVLMPLAFVVGAGWGVTGLALAWLAMYPVVFALVAWRTCRRVGVALLDYGRQFAAPLAAGLVMFGVVLWAGDRVPGEAGDILHLLALVALGAVSYVGVMAMLAREALAETLSIARA